MTDDPSCRASRKPQVSAEPALRRVACGRRFAPQVRSILNEAIENGTALWDYAPRSAESVEQWFAAKEARGDPVIGLVDGSGRLAAFGTYGEFRAWPAYKYSVEHSVYVEKSRRGQGLGKSILQLVVESAAQRGYHNLIGGLESGNQASVRLHESCGFELCGTVRHAGFKFGRWLDLSFYQRLLDGPRAPVDG